MTFILIIHSLVCVLLVVVILMQAGRGGGLTESFAAAESVFGARTNEFMVRATAVLAVVFLVTSLGLAHMSARRDQSLMDRLMDKSKNPDIKINIPMDDTKAGDETSAPALKDEKAAAASSVTLDASAPVATSSTPSDEKK